MDIFRICRTCLNQSNADFVSIHSIINTENAPIETKITINCILDEITGDRYKSDDFPYPDKICGNCLNNLKVAFDFKHQCLVAFDQLLQLSNIETVIPERNVLVESTEEEKLIAVDEIFCNAVVITESKFELPEPVENITQNQSSSITQIEIEKFEEAEVKEVKCNTAKLKTYQCDICKRTFTRTTHLRRHMTIHTDERKYACKLCDKKFRRADHLKVHENYHAQIKPHTCEHCQKTFSRSEHLRRHISSRHTTITSTFECKDCEYVGESSKELKQHRRSHDSTVYECKYCDQTFPTKPKLSNHIRSHNDERPFLCSECGMRFIRNDYLVVHMRRHTGEKPYKCKFCSRAFPRATDLNVHEKYHTNDKKHTCNVCGKGFQRAYNLNVHKRVHTREKPYQCSHCSRSFSQCNDLKTHIRRHTGERYQCNICDASFIQIYLLTNHKKNVHGIDTKSNISRLIKFDGVDQGTVASMPQIDSFQQQNEFNCTEFATNEC